MFKIHVISLLTTKKKVKVYITSRILVGKWNEKFTQLVRREKLNMNQLKQNK
jgi:hypothetical protein